MWQSEQKPAMFAYKLKLILLPQLIATLNNYNYACSLPPLANVNWSASPECFFWPCKSMTGEMAPLEGSNLVVKTWYGSHCQQKSVYALWWNIDPLWVHMDVIVTLNSTICAILLLCCSLCYHPPHSYISPIHTLIYTGPTLL